MHYPSTENRGREGRQLTIPAQKPSIALRTEEEKGDNSLFQHTDSMKKKEGRQCTTLAQRQYNTLPYNNTLLTLKKEIQLSAFDK